MTVASRAVLTVQFHVLLLSVACWSYSSPARATFVQEEMWEGGAGVFAFGGHTALSNAGDLALVDDAYDGPACPRVFRRNPATQDWHEEFFQQPAGCSGVLKHGVLSGNGGVIAVIDGPGRVVRSYVFDGVVWQLEHTSGPIGTEPLRDTKLSEDGSTLIVSAQGGPSLVRMFHELLRTPGGWVLAATVTLPGTSAIYAMGVSGDAQHVAIATTNDFGTLYTWRKQGTAWVPGNTLPRPPGINYFGHDVAMSGDGSTMLVTADKTYDDCVAGDCAVIRVYVRQGTSWVWHQDLEQPLEDNGHGLDPGYLALSKSGAFAAVGVENVNCESAGCSAVFLYRRQGLSWHMEQTIHSTESLYGRYVAVSGNAEMLLVGAPYHDCASAQSCGAAYLYDFTPAQSGGCSGPVMLPGCFEIPSAYGQPPFVAIGCEIVDCCPLCPGMTEIEWLMRLDGSPVRQVVVQLERLDAQQLARLRLSGPAQWVSPGLLRIQPGDDVIVSGFSLPRAALRWTVASPRMTFRSVTAEPGRNGEISGEIRLRVEQRTPQGRLGESSIVYELKEPLP